MSDLEDIYYDAISTGGPITGDTRDCQDAGDKISLNQKGSKGQGRVSQLASQYMRQASKNHTNKSNQETSDANTYLDKIQDLQLRINSANRQVRDNQSRALNVTENVVEGDPSVYSFATPFPEDLSENGKSDQVHVGDTSWGQGQLAEERLQGEAVNFIDSLGYSHPNKTSVNENISKVVSENQKCERQSPVENTTLTYDHISPQNQAIVPGDLHVEHYITQNETHHKTVFENDFEHVEEENIYDSVHNSLDSRNGPVSDGFEFVHHEQVAISAPVPGTSCDRKHGRGRTAEKRQMKTLADEIQYDWKRKQAKKKSRALKRSTRSGRQSEFN